MVSEEVAVQLPPQQKVQLTPQQDLQQDLQDMQ
jgi:hypothetical protein